MGNYLNTDPQGTKEHKQTNLLSTESKALPQFLQPQGKISDSVVSDCKWLDKKNSNDGKHTVMLNE